MIAGAVLGAGVKVGPGATEGRREDVRVEFWLRRLLLRPRIDGREGRRKDIRLGVGL